MSVDGAEKIKSGADAPRSDSFMRPVVRWVHEFWCAWPELECTCKLMSSRKKERTA